MSLLNRVKAVLGLNGAARSQREEPVAVTVEEEPSVDPEPEPTPSESVEEQATDVEASDDDSEDDSEPVTEISGIGPAYAEKLADADIETVEQLRDADPEAVAERSELSAGRVAGWIEAARAR